MIILFLISDTEIFYFIFLKLVTFSDKYERRCIDKEMPILGVKHNTYDIPSKWENI